MEFFAGWKFGVCDEQWSILWHLRGPWYSTQSHGSRGWQSPGELLKWGVLAWSKPLVSEVPCDSQRALPQTRGTGSTKRRPQVGIIREHLLQPQFPVGNLVYLSWHLLWSEKMGFPVILTGVAQTMGLHSSCRDAFLHSHKLQKSPGANQLSNSCEK